MGNNSKQSTGRIEYIAKRIFSDSAPKKRPHRDIDNACEGKDKNGVKEGEEVPLGGEGGEEEADEGDAGDVADGQGEQAEEPLHCISHSQSYLILILASGLDF